MAFTATLVKQNVIGAQRMAVYNVTADAASGQVMTPLGNVEAYNVQAISMNSLNGHYQRNLNNASAACMGCMFFSSVTNGDNFFLFVYGRS